MRFYELPLASSKGSNDIYCPAITILYKNKQLQHTTIFHLILYVVFNAVLLMPANALAQIPNISLIESGFIFDTAVFKSCHASTVVQLANDKLMAAWFGGDHEGSPDVCIWTAI